jgi:hypothetical protein
MTQFAKNLELDSTLASGLSTTSQRSTSTHYDQRRSLNASGVVVLAAGSREYIADGLYGLSDYYPLTVNATGILQVDIRNQRECGDVVILNSAGTEVMTASPSKYSSRSAAVTQQRIAASGSYAAYIQLKGRTGSEYRIGIEVQER